MRVCLSVCLCLLVCHLISPSPSLCMSLLSPPPPPPPPPPLSPPPYPFDSLSLCPCLLPSLSVCLPICLCLSVCLLSSQTVRLSSSHLLSLFTSLSVSLRIFLSQCVCARARVPPPTTTPPPPPYRFISLRLSVPLSHPLLSPQPSLSQPEAVCCCRLQKNRSPRRP